MFWGGGRVITIPLKVSSEYFLKDNSFMPLSGILTVIKNISFSKITSQITFRFIYVFFRCSDQCPWSLASFSFFPEIYCNVLTPILFYTYRIYMIICLLWPYLWYKPCRLTKDEQLTAIEYFPYHSHLLDFLAIIYLTMGTFNLIGTFFQIGAFFFKTSQSHVELNRLC